MSEPRHLSLPFKERLNQDVITALKAREKVKLKALRLIVAAVKQFEIDNRAELDEEAAVGVLTKMAKQRRESIAQFEPAGRSDLVEIERFELDLIAGYLPEQLSDDEVDARIEAAIGTTGATSMRDMGKVMGHVQAELRGRADMAEVSAKVKCRLIG
ncbi:MAG: GatB/YqeY domain-containing protein [Pseudomonadota bacterium]|nr:GatB/YqeY domain-containing protein [Pseudomonadota bacterium]